jgi:hypothetical protein
MPPPLRTFPTGATTPQDIPTWCHHPSGINRASPGSSVTRSACGRARRCSGCAAQSGAPTLTELWLGDSPSGCGRKSDSRQCGRQGVWGCGLGDGYRMEEISTADAAGSIGPPNSGNFAPCPESRPPAGDTCSRETCTRWRMWIWSTWSQMPALAQTHTHTHKHTHTHARTHTHTHTHTCTPNLANPLHTGINPCPPIGGTWLAPPRGRRA